VSQHHAGSWSFHPETLSKRGSYCGGVFYSYEAPSQYFFSSQLSVGSLQLTDYCQLISANYQNSSRKQITQGLQLIPHITRLLALGYAVDLRAALQHAIETVGGMPGKT